MILDPQPVSDGAGIGISAADFPHIFERFRQGSLPAASSNGLGLGLTIAQALVELHGGRIQVASPGEGLGTTCTIELPMRTDLSPPRAHRHAREKTGD